MVVSNSALSSESVLWSLSSDGDAQTLNLTYQAPGAYDQLCDCVHNFLNFCLGFLTWEMGQDPVSWHLGQPGGVGWEPQVSVLPAGGVHILCCWMRAPPGLGYTVPRLEPL